MPRHQLPPGPGRPPLPPGERKVPIAAKIDPRLRDELNETADRFFGGSKITALEVCLRRGIAVETAERTAEDDSE